MTAAEDWPIAQVWKTRGLHWHAYVEQRPLSSAGDREERLRQPPAELLTTPTEVATWLDVSLRAAIALPGESKGGKGTGKGKDGAKEPTDTRDFSDSFRVHESLASHGESIYTGVRGDITFLVEAVTDTECQVPHDSPEVPSIRKRRKRE
jgi:hypothetical protein